MLEDHHVMRRSIESLLAGEKGARKAMGEKVQIHIFIPLGKATCITSPNYDTKAIAQIVHPHKCAGWGSTLITIGA